MKFFKNGFAFSFLVCLFSISSSLPAQDSAGAPGSFLRMGVGMRAMAMGKAFTAVANDASAGYWNPAGLDQLQHMQVELMYSQLPLDQTNHFISAAFPLKWVGTIGVSWIGLRINNLEARSANTTVPDYYFSDSENAILFSLGKRVSQRVAIGVNIKWLYHNLDIYTATGFGFDAGILVKPVQKLKIGFMLQDASSSQRWESGYTDIYPHTMRLGTSLQLFSNLMAAFDLEKAQHENVRLHGGTETQLLQHISVQLGYSDHSFCGGASLSLPVNDSDIRLGYRYAPFQIVDQAVHSFSLSISFSKKTRSKKDDLPKRDFFVTETKKQKMVEVNTAVLNVRKGAGLNYDIITQVRLGNRFVIVEKKSEWIKIRLDESRYGWISAKYVTSKKTDQQFH